MSLILFSRGNCGKCAEVKAMLHNAGIRHERVDLDKTENEHKKNVLLLLGFRSLPLFGVMPGREENISADLREVLPLLQRLYKKELEECENFFSPASDHFETRCNERRKDFLRGQIAAIDKFLEGKNG